MNNNEKTCPQCAEPVKAAATICRFCNYKFPTTPATISKSSDAEAAGSPSNWTSCVGLILIMGAIGAIVRCAGGGEEVSDNAQTATVDSSDSNGSDKVAQKAPAKSAPEPTSSDSSSEDDEEVPPLELDAAYVSQAYANNEAAAQREFGLKSLAVHGMVAGVDLDFLDRPVVLLNGHNDAVWVNVHLNSSSRSKAGSLNTGQRVTVVCSLISEVRGTPILEKCDLYP